MRSATSLLESESGREARLSHGGKVGQSFDDETCGGGRCCVLWEMLRIFDGVFFGELDVHHHSVSHLFVDDVILACCPQGWERGALMRLTM